MSDDRSSGEREQKDPPEGAREEARRRRRMAEIFGDVIPEQTSDDTGDEAGAGRRTEEQAQEDWLRSQVPPHHG